MYTARTALSIALWDAGPEFEVEVVVKFTVTKFRPQTEINPEEPPSVENINIRLFSPKGTLELSCPDWLHEKIVEDNQFKTWLLSAATGQDEDARDNAAEARREQLREEREL